MTTPNIVFVASISGLVVGVVAAIVVIAVATVSGIKYVKQHRCEHASKEAGERNISENKS